MLQHQTWRHNPKNSDLCLGLCTPVGREHPSFKNFPNGSSPQSRRTAPQSVSASVRLPGNFPPLQTDAGKDTPIQHNTLQWRGRGSEAGSAWERVNKWRRGVMVRWTQSCCCSRERDDGWTNSFLLQSLSFLCLRRCCSSSDGLLCKCRPPTHQSKLNTAVQQPMLWWTL